MNRICHLVDVLLVVLALWSIVDGLPLEGKCTKNDPRQIFPNCMFDDTSKTLWCDQSNYKKLPGVPEINSHLIDSDCKAAKALFVNDSCLREIGRDDLQPYRKIESFVGGKNLITFLKNSTFEKNRHLGQIDLCHNAIDDIEEKAFAGLKKLRVLHLNNNRIAKIPRHTFRGLLSLEVLTMEHNRLQAIEHHHFSHLRSLKTLNLRGNNISHIGQATFSTMHSLTHLHLDGNDLEIIDINTFHGLKRLRILTLSHNRIKHWPTEYGGMFVHLHTLHLGNNELDEFKPAHTANMTSLQNLSLDNNSLTKIAEDLFKSTPRMRYLNLSGNYIDDIPVKTFETLCHLESLILKGNQLKTPRMEWFQHIIKKNVNETHTAINENPWECDCDTITFQNMRDSLRHHHNLTGRILATRLQITCTLPTYAENRILDRNLADEIQFRKKCPTTAAFDAPKRTPNATAAPGGCNTTKSFKHENFDVTSQYVPQKQRALAVVAIEKEIAEGSLEAVETGGSQIWIIVVVVVIIGISILLTLLFVFYRKTRKRDNSCDDWFEFCCVNMDDN